VSVVVAYTPDVIGEAAVSTAISEAALRKHELVIFFPSDRTARAPYEELGRAESAARAQGVSVIVEVLADADPVNATLDAVDRHRADLLVIGLPRRSPVGKLLLGSPAQRLLLSAPCPVLAVK
jgi:nucleotide-binding universal stress UspA family protein